MTQSRVALGALIIGAALLGHGARAEGFYFGGLIGADIGTANGINFAFSGGGNCGYKLLPFLSLGVFSTYFGSGQNGATISQTNLAPEFNLYSGAFHLGVDVGIAFISVLVPGSPAIGSTTLIYGPEMGFDVMISEYMSLGIEGHLYFSNPGGSFAVDIEPLVAIKVWL